MLTLTSLGVPGATVCYTEVPSWAGEERVKSGRHFPCQTRLPVVGLPLSHEEGRLGAFSRFVGVRKDSLWTDHDPAPLSESSDKVLQSRGAVC